MVSQSSQPLKFAPEIDPSKRPWDCKALTAILGVHLLCLAAPFYFSWSGLVVCLVFCWLGGGIGITLAYHRLLTHHSFTTPNWFKYLISLCGCLQWQGGPIRWVGTHRLHHRDSDQEADPHTPRHGFTWAHMTWCLRLDGDGFEPFEAAKDLSKDPIMCLIEKYFYVPQFVLMGVLFGAGYAYGHYVPGEHSPLYMGMSWFVWGVAVRTVLSYHGTWFVNSAAHTWGYQNFKTTDDSRNTWWVASSASAKAGTTTITPSSAQRHTACGGSSST